MFYAKLRVELISYLQLDSITQQNAALSKNLQQNPEHSNRSGTFVSMCVCYVEEILERPFCLHQLRALLVIL